MANPHAVIFTARGKLSAAETLDQAKQALEAHKDWMRRRVQNSVVPSPDLLEDLEPPAPKQAPWAIDPAAPRGIHHFVAHLAKRASK